MKDKTFFVRLREFGVFSGLPAEDIDVLSGLLAHLELSLLDCLTLRDLLQLTGLGHDSALFAVLALMFALLAEGSLCLDVSFQNLTARLKSGCGPQAAQRLAGLFRSRLAQAGYTALITEQQDAYLPLVVAKRDRVRLLYFQRLFVHEQGLARRVASFLAQSPLPAPDQGQIDDIVEGLFSAPFCLRQTPGGAPLEKDARQVEALKRCLVQRFSIISGGPGTGKTSLMVNLLRALVRSGTPAERIVLGAPTGRAAQRMSEALQQAVASIAEADDRDRALLRLTGRTLHKILGYRRDTNEFRYNAGNPLPAAAVVIDEVSMVDVVMMHRFLEALEAGKTQLVLLGDRDQLPSVEAGAVFAHMTPQGAHGQRFRKHMVVLERVYRSGKQLAALAAAVNRGKVPPKDPVSFERALKMPADSWCRVAYAGDRRWRRDLAGWLNWQYLRPRDGRPGFRELVLQAGGRKAAELMHGEAGRALLSGLFSSVDGCRILALVRHGAQGSNAANRHLAAELSFAIEQVSAGPEELFSGAVVMVTRNDYARGLFNGEVGLALRDPDGLCRVYFKRAGGFISFLPDQLPAWEFGYALTVHKSQGSEFDDVLLVLPPDENHRLLSREAVYTAVTRARRRVVVYGRRRVLNAALSRRVERTSGLSW